MADITHLFLRRHLRSGPTAWTRHSVGGRVRREGVGLSYAFRAGTAVISEVPVEDRELSLVAHGRTADQAEVSVPLGITVGVAEIEHGRAAAEVEAERVRGVGVAEAAGEAARVAALRDVPAEVLGALALRELAARLPEIGQLTPTRRVSILGTASPDFGDGESPSSGRRVSVFAAVSLPFRRVAATWDLELRSVDVSRPYRRRSRIGIAAPRAARTEAE